MKIYPAHKLLWLKLISSFSCLLLVCGSTIPPECKGGDQPHPASRWPTCEDTATSQQISFVHTSDTHARYNPSPGGSSPLARIRGFYEQVKKDNPYTLLTNAGDDYEKGSIAEELSQGLTTRQVVQAMRYDVRTLGNHDLAWGLDELLAFSRDPAAVVLATNTKLDIQEKSGGDTKDSKVPGWVDYAEITVGCVKIGFFGLISKPWTENGEQYEGPYYHGHPELQTDFNHLAIAREVVAQHRQDVDLLVLVSHLGIDDDTFLAEQVEGIDLILGGHTHTTMTESLRVGNTTIIHTGSHAENLGRFDLDYSLRDREITASHYALTPNTEGKTPVDKATDQKISQIISPYQEAIQSNFARLSSRQSKKEMALIAARAAVETTGAAAALINPLSAWQEGKQGGMTPQEVLTTFPVEREPAGEPGIGSLYLIKATGADLLHARASLPDFAYWGPDAINPAALYTIALQKPQARSQQRYFGRELSPAPPLPAGELWRAVVTFGRDRNNANLSLDERAMDRDRGRDLLAALLRNR